MITLRNPFRTYERAAEVMPLAAAGLTPFEEGDIVRNAYGELCRIEQIGWKQQTSPMALEAECGFVRALVQGYELSPEGDDWRTWQEWTLVDELTPAERKGARRFRRVDEWYFESKAAAAVAATA